MDLLAIGLLVGLVVFVSSLNILVNNLAKTNDGKLQLISLLKIVTFLILLYAVYHTGYFAGVQEGQRFPDKPIDPYSRLWFWAVVYMLAGFWFLQNWSNDLKRSPRSNNQSMKNQIPIKPSEDKETLTPSLEVPPVCPICNLEMDKITIPTGHPEAGQQAWRCLNFKTCHQWQPVQEKENS